MFSLKALTLNEEAWVQPSQYPKGEVFFQLFPYGFKIQRVLTLLLLWPTIVEEKLDSSYTKGNSECRGILAYGQTGSGTSGSERRVTTRSPCVDGTFHRWNWSIVAGPLFFFKCTCWLLMAVLYTVILFCFVMAIFTLFWYGFRLDCASNVVLWARIEN